MLNFYRRHVGDASLIFVLTETLHLDYVMTVRFNIKMHGMGSFKSDCYNVTHDAYC